ncbi:hypothetical protein DMB38_16030 [Streptomyces sp. WAC 06738]|uniref:hypothetical protein n=1 Tax=Streptomyces sp. WAC 06738 TaxID=2203210 RepID=UPI000F6D3AF6|nr:hypothetical protein [Streptomyces sp. WAC 06738]AZM47110.1 hypothetical protein DMB38_16030 [Streptomyces sp. WAC 06738]
MNATQHHDAGHGQHDAHAAHHGHHAPAGPAGLDGSEDGYTLALETTEAPAGTETELRFRLLGADGRPVTDLTPIHDKLVHLIAVRRDLTRYVHVHPAEAADGTWSVRVLLPEAGSYRVFADFAPAALGRTLTLGADLTAGDGAGPARELPAPAPAFTVDGREVTLTGELAAGEGRRLEFAVARDGEPVTDLQPYLAAYGHLVAVRREDLAYVHVHPDGSPGDGTTEPGPVVAFHAQVPGPGTYRLFLDFKHEDAVRTAEFTAVVR